MKPSRVRALAIVIVVAASPRGLAQAPALRPQRLELPQGVLLGSSRMTAMGGAFTAVAEGGGGLPSNLAAVAQRQPTLDRAWDVGGTLSWYTAPPGQGAQDYQNDGRPAPSESRLQALGGLLLQYKNWGAGLYVRFTAGGFCPDGVCDPSKVIGLNTSRGAVAIGVALFQDRLIVGAGAYSSTIDFMYGNEKWTYQGGGLEVDLLYRPPNEPFRFGVSVKPQVEATYQTKNGQALEIAGQSLYSGVVLPWVLSWGASWRLGAGAELYNNPSPYASRQYGLPCAPDAISHAREFTSGRWLLAAQIDLQFPAFNTVPLFTAFSPSPPNGARSPLRWTPRLGAEHTTVPGRLRTRLGSFLEPSGGRGQPPRPHLTGGAELFLFRLLTDWSASLSFDASRGYSNIGLSLGFW